MNYPAIYEKFMLRLNYPEQLTINKILHNKVKRLQFFLINLKM